MLPRLMSFETLEASLVQDDTVCLQKIAIIGEQYIVVSSFSFVFFRVSDKTSNKCSKDSFIQI